MPGGKGLGQHDLPEGRRQSYAQQQQQDAGVERLPGSPLQGKEEKRTQTNRGGHTGEMHDHGPHVHVAHAMQPDHGHGREEAAGQHDQGRQVRVGGLRLLDEDDSAQGAGNRPPHAQRRSLLSTGQLTRHPHRKHVRQRQHVGNEQPRQGIEGADHAMLPAMLRYHNVRGRHRTSRTPASLGYPSENTSASGPLPAR